MQIVAVALMDGCGGIFFALDREGRIDVCGTKSGAEGMRDFAHGFAFRLLEECRQ